MKELIESILAEANIPKYAGLTYIKRLNFILNGTRLPIRAMASKPRRKGNFIGIEGGISHRNWDVKFRGSHFKATLSPHGDVFKLDWTATQGYRGSDAGVKKENASGKMTFPRTTGPQEMMRALLKEVKGKTSKWEIPDMKINGIALVRK